jgi:hypothetical protein
MSVEEQQQTLKRGRPKKIKTQEEIDAEKQKKREIKQKWYQEHKNDIQQQHKKYYDEHKDELSQKHKSYYQEYKEHKHTEINQKSKVLQSKYREGYRILCKLIEDNAILPSYLNLEEIKKFIVQ